MDLTKPLKVLPKENLIEMEEFSECEKYASVENRVSSTYETLDNFETGVREGTRAVSNANDDDTTLNKRSLKKRLCFGISVAVVAVTIVALSVMLVVLKSKGGSCTTDAQIKNGKIVDTTGADHGDTRTIECEEGHKLVGSAVLTCLSSNQWSDSPECIPKHCDLFDAPNFMTTETDFNLTQVGTNLTLKCQDGFILQGVGSVICQNNETWSSLPTCEPIDCGLPNNITNGMLVGLLTTTYNSSASVKCNEGFVLTTNGTISCNVNGLWDKMPKCEPVLCGLPIIPTNGSISRIDGTTFTSIAAINCNEGFKVVGNQVVRCTSNGSWTQYPTCEQTDSSYCTENACLHGECVDGIGNFSCSCYPGFEGTRCEKYINKCMSNPCLHGHCFNGLDTYKCLCYQGYTGQNCDFNINDCLTNPCMNGNCTDEINGYNCTCLAGYTGTNCEHYIDACSPNPCQHGTCTDDIQTYNCTCFVGFNGSNCENNIDDCVSNPCINGRCIDGVNEYSCTCLSDYTGKNCEQNIDACTSNPCLNGTCADGINNYTCTCNSGFDGINCENDIDECENNACESNSTCVDNIGNYTCVCRPGLAGEHCEMKVNDSDCYDIALVGGSSSGIYTVQLWISGRTIHVYCDMDTDGGGWTVFQYRFDGSIDFFKNFSEYENGFGSLNEEFWLGLKYIQEMTDQGKSELRLDLEAADGTTAYETFQNFYLGKPTLYTLYIDKGIGTAGDSLGLSYHKGFHFTTYDADRDQSSGNCAILDHGGWWYGNCAYANLNGEYVTPGTQRQQYAEGGMTYRSFRTYESLKSSKMMFRRV